MPKSTKLNKAEQYIKNKLPQLGFFSTLDELIASAPFEENSIEQWRNYLKSGRVLERDGVRFPLKQEEIDYSGLMRADLEGIKTGLANKWTKEELRQMIQGSRPDMALRVGIERLSPGPSPRVQQFPGEYNLSLEGGRRPPEVGQARYSEWAYPGLAGKYEESATRSTDFGPFETHFGPDVISHSRTSVHNAPPPLPTGGGFESSYQNPNNRLARLVEEIQSDRHQKAAERGNPPDWGELMNPEEEAQWRQLWEENRDDEARAFEQSIRNRAPRIGYRTPEEEQELLELGYHDLRDINDADTMEKLSRFEKLRRKVPDAPFKDPSDYGLLELRKQLLNAVGEDQDYLALVRGRDVIDRFTIGGGEQAGAKHVYDKVYPAALQKLARQYGASVEDITLPNIARKADVRPRIMIDLDVEDIDGLVGSVVDMADDLDTQRPLDHPNSADGEAIQVFDRLNDVVREMVNVTNEPSKEIKEQGLRAAWAIKSLKDKWKHSGLTANSDQDSAFRTATRELKKLYSMYEPIAKRLVDEGDLAVATSFPAMKLSPEVKELVKKVGVPIWALGSMSLLGEDEETGMAEGGKVDRSSKSLKNLQKTMEFLGSHLDGREIDPQQKRRLGLVTSGLASQLYGLDTEGDLSFLGFDPRRPNKGISPLSKLIGMMRPGLVDDLVSLPAMFSDNAPKVSQEAAARMEALENRILGELDLTPAEGFAENFAQSLGIMGGQIPVPGGALKKGAKETVHGIKRMRDLLKKITTSPVEFLAPTVDPSVLNYGVGAGFGSVLGGLGGPEGSPGSMPVPDDSVWNRRLEDLVAKKSKGGKIKGAREDIVDWLERAISLMRPHIPTMSVPESVVDQVDTILNEESMRSGVHFDQLNQGFMEALQEEMARVHNKHAKGGKITSLTERLEKAAQKNLDDFISRSVKRAEKQALQPRKNRARTPRLAKQVVSFDELNKWLEENPDLAEDFGLDPDEPDPGYYLEEANENFMEFLAQNGLVPDWEGGTLQFDPATFKTIRNESQKIQDEWEVAQSAPKKTGIPLLNTDPDALAGQPTWAKYDLYGDDDVDYHGGYITNMLDLLEAYVRGKGG